MQGVPFGPSSGIFTAYDSPGGHLLEVSSATLVYVVRYFSQVRLFRDEVRKGFGLDIPGWNIEVCLAVPTRQN